MFVQFWVCHRAWVFDVSVFEIIGSYTAGGACF